MQVFRSNIAPTLDGMPDDVVLEIWSGLKNPASFSRISKRFNAFSKLASFRARWFIQRFPSYLVLFEAIARPKLLDADLVARLTRLGAPLSRNLAQLLLTRSASTLWHPPTPNGIKWGQSLQLGAFLALLGKAHELYGDSLSLQSLVREEQVLESWIHQQKGSHSDPSPDIAALFSDFKFMPLPLTIDFLNKATKAQPNKAEDALAYAPRLAPFYLANGYEPNEASSAFISETILFNNDETDSARQAEQLRELQEYAVLQVPRSVALSVFYKLSSLRVEEARVSKVMESYRALKQMSSHLTFDLEAVVEGELDATCRRLIRATDVPLLKLVEEDYPNMDVRSAYVAAMFLKANLDELRDLDVVAAMMGKHEVHAKDVLQACLRQECTSAMPLRYGAKFVKGFQLEPVLVELVEALLHQPYRGLMLRALYWMCVEAQSCQSADGIDFPSLLAQAVERKAFSADQLPAQQWSRFEEDPTRSADATASATGQQAYACNRELPVRSLLSFSWKTNGEGDESASWSVKQARKQRSELSNGPTTLQSFTRFVPLHDRNDASNVLLDDKRHKEVWYVGDNERNHVALAIVDLLGPQSRAADVLLAHSLLNLNETLTTRLLKLGVAVTLEHIKIVLRIGSPVPLEIYVSLAFGAPFKATFDSAAGQPDTILGSGLTFSQLTEAELEDCLAARGPENEGEVRVRVDVDETGVLSIANTSDAQHVSFVEKIFTRAPARTYRLVASVSAAASMLVDGVTDDCDRCELSDSDFIVYCDNMPKIVSKRQLDEWIQTLTLWTCHLDCLKQLEDKKRAALRIALHHADSSDVFDRTLRNSTAAGQLEGALAFLYSWIKDLKGAKRVDQVEPSLVELASLYQEIGEAEGDKAVQRMRACVHYHAEMELPRRSTDCRRRSWTRGLHAIRREQDSWEEITRKAGLAPSNQELLDPDFVPEDESGSSESEGEEITSEPQRKRAKIASSSTQASDSSTELQVSGRSGNESLAIGGDKHEQSQQQAAGSTSISSSSRDVFNAENASLEEQQVHPVYAHPLFDETTFERMRSRGSEVGQRLESIEDTYEKFLMQKEARELTKQRRWGSPDKELDRIGLFGYAADARTVHFVPTWLPPHLRADIYRKPL